MYLFIFYHSFITFTFAASIGETLFRMLHPNLPRSTTSSLWKVLHPALEIWLRIPQYYGCEVEVAGETNILTVVPSRTGNEASDDLSVPLARHILQLLSVDADGSQWQIQTFVMVEGLLSKFPLYAFPQRPKIHLSWVRRECCHSLSFAKIDYFFELSTPCIVVQFLNRDPFYDEWVDEVFCYLFGPFLVDSTIPFSTSRDACFGFPGRQAILKTISSISCARLNNTWKALTFSYFKEVEIISFKLVIS